MNTSTLPQWQQYENFLQAPIDKNGVLMEPQDLEDDFVTRSVYYGVAIFSVVPPSTERINFIEVRTSEGYQTDKALAEEIIASLREFWEVKRTLESINNAIDRHNSHPRANFSGSTSERVAQVLRMYETTAIDTLAGVKQFRDDQIVLLRAINLVLDTVGGASTHKEKDARLRGALELIDSGVEKLRKAEFELNGAAHRMFPDLYRADYPTQRLYTRIHDLEAEITRLKGKRTEDDFDDSDPFADE